MKQISKTTLKSFFAAMALTAALGSQAASHSDWRNLPSGTIDSNNPEVVTGDTVGYVTGRFLRQQPDTLYCIALGCFSYEKPVPGEEPDYMSNHIDTFVLSNTAAGIPDLYIVGNPFLNNLIVSDLDADGLDEIQTEGTWYSSTWRQFFAYDLANGKWMWLADPLNYWAGDEEDYGLPRFFPHPNSQGKELFVIEDCWTDNGMEKKNLYKPVQRQEIRAPFTTCYTLPGGRAKTLPLKEYRQD